MTLLRKALLGYDMKQVNQHLRRFVLLSENELTELEQLIVKTQKELTLLGHESTPPSENSEQPAVIEETAAGLVEELEQDLVEEIEVIEVIEEIEKAEVLEEVKVEEVNVIEEVEEEVMVLEVEVEVEVEATVEPVAETIELEETVQLEETIEVLNEVEFHEDETVVEDSQQQSIAHVVQEKKERNRMGRLLIFRRKLDASNKQEEEQHESPEEIESSSYWESIDHYLATPVISEEILTVQTVVANSLSQAQQVVSNSAVGLPSYFDYNLSEAQTPVHVDSSHLTERRVRTQTSSMNTSKKTQQATYVETDKRAEPSTSVQSQGSKEISKEVRHLRYKYVVGKYAGEDLVNNQGRLIVGKNNPITEEVVDAAEREGLLALLIVHMTIPGLGDDI
jgi:hypothetical protein